MLAPETRPRQLDRFLGKDLGDEYVFYDAEGEKVHVLNATARRIYLLCDGTHTLQEIVQALVADYGIAEPMARDDAVETLERFADLGLVSLA